MHNICVIPARMASSRFPGKPLAPIAGMPMLGHVAKRCILSNVFDRVVVATCDSEIQQYCDSIGVEAVLTSSSHERATDRVQEAVENLENNLGCRYTTVTLVQGDEPMITEHMLRTALEGLLPSDVQVVNLKSPITSYEEYTSPNCVKVVCDKNDDALYFSRAGIPVIQKDHKDFSQAFKQVCVIPFKRNFLDIYSKLSPTPLEISESIDMNRVIEHGYSVRCYFVEDQSYPVDVPDDLTRAESFILNQEITKQYHCF